MVLLKNRVRFLCDVRCGLIPALISVVVLLVLPLAPCVAGIRFLVLIIVWIEVFGPMLVSAWVGIWTSVGVLFCRQRRVLVRVTVGALRSFKVVEPTFVPAASFVFEGAPAGIRMECVAFAIAPLFIVRDTSMIVELLADCWVVKPAFFLLGAVSPGVVSADFFLLLDGILRLGRFTI